ncbi:hypothetical protein K9N08_01790 [Candidatus Gracilibacteria bacterium]|nr:hypothetical protein [Candidatus Gracilibacteria bacterium]MCF7856269.1 hypothetical protein [Candidatus Gracilibacteria bacterium]MCF7896252.1 hypothetical protein [Candidatus Gracilibacteria bacterium]
MNKASQPSDSGQKTEIIEVRDPDFVSKVKKIIKADRGIVEVTLSSTEKQPGKLSCSSSLLFLDQEIGDSSGIPLVYEGSPNFESIRPLGGKEKSKIEKWLKSV